MPITNEFVSLFDRSYQQNKANIKTVMGAYVPEISDHTENEVFVRTLSNIYGLFEMLGVNCDLSAEEIFFNRAKLYRSMVEAAFNVDYRVKGALSATVNLRFVLSAVAGVNVVIPAGTEVSNGQGISFYTTAILTILAGQIDGFVDAKQELTITGVNIGTTDGLAGQVVELEADFIVDKSIAITISANAWTPMETLAHSNTLAKVFVSSMSINQKTQVRFGDNITGAIPPAAQTITASYKITLGEAGNVAPLTVTTIVGAVTVPAGIVLTVQNIDEASGGADYESIGIIVRNLPLWNRTKDRAVSEQDYIDIGTMAPGVAKAGVDYSCGKVVDVYIAPVGGGIATQSLLDDVLAWYNDKRRMLTTKIDPHAAGEVNLVFEIDVHLEDSALKTEKDAEIKAQLEDVYSVVNQDIKGQAKLSDIYEIVETTPGVKNSDVKVMTTIPYAFIREGTSPLVWTRATNSTSTTTVKWRIVIINATDFQLLKDGSYVGTYVIGTPVVLAEITFTVTASSYSVGDQWDFVTYKYFGNLTLDEMSIPIVDAANVTLNFFGGI